MFGMDKARKIQRISKMRVTKIALVERPATQEPAVLLKNAQATVSPLLAPADAPPPDTMTAWGARVLAKLA